MIGRKFGIGDVAPLAPEKTRDIGVLGISGSSRQKAGMSKSERLLIRALELYRSYGCDTTFLRLKDLRIYDYEGELLGEPGILYLLVPVLAQVS